MSTTDLQFIWTILFLQNEVKEHIQELDPNWAIEKTPFHLVMWLSIKS